MSRQLNLPDFKNVKEKFGVLTSRHAASSKRRRGVCVVRKDAGEISTQVSGEAGSN